MYSRHTQIHENKRKNKCEGGASITNYIEKLPQASDDEKKQLTKSIVSGRNSI